MFRRSNVGTRHQNSPTAMSRRAAVAAMAAVPLSVQLSVYPAVADDAVADLIKTAGEKNAAFMRGDMEGWAKPIRIAPDFTLMRPFGAPARPGYDTSPKRVAQLAQYFQNGTTKLEIAQTYASDGFVVLVMI